MSEKSNIVEKIILFAVFVVFAIIIVSFAFNMERIDVKEPQSDGFFSVCNIIKAGVQIII